MNNSIQYVRNDELLATDVDGDKVMMHIESGYYFSLNSVAAYIWDKLETPRSIEDLIARVAETFDISDAETLESDVRSFIDEMLSKDLVSRASV